MLYVETMLFLKGESCNRYDNGSKISITCIRTVQTALFHIHTYQGINVQFVISFLFYCISVLQIIKRKSKRSKHSGKNKLLHVHLLANCLASSEQRSCEDSIYTFKR